MTTTEPAAPLPRTEAWTPWRVVVWFGVVSLAADMVYEGARSMYGPLLSTLGASALVVGLITGVGEAMALVLRLAFGPMADRHGTHWSLTMVGYGLTAVCVPLLALSPLLGGAGLVFASALILLERTGKAVRSPSKSALLAQAATQVGRGRGFGIHKAMDQVGSFSGPLVVAAVGAWAGTIWPALAVLAVPGAVAMAVLVILRKHVPAIPAAPVPARDDEPSASATVAVDADVAQRRAGWLSEAFGSDLPSVFFRYAVAASLTTGGLVTFGIIGYHLVHARLLDAAAVPLVYAAGMAAAALAALAVGVVYDQVGASALLVVPVLVALVPLTALAPSVGWAIAGVLIWGTAAGVQDSTIKAAVAQLVVPARRATGYGVFAGIQGAFAIVGGLVSGWLYDRSLTALVVLVAVTQLTAFVLLARLSGASRSSGA